MNQSQQERFLGGSELHNKLAHPVTNNDTLDQKAVFRADDTRELTTKNPQDTLNADSAPPLLEN